MKRGALFVLLCAAGLSFADTVAIPPPAPQRIPEVTSVRKIVTLSGLGTRTYWATAKESSSLESILRVRQSDGTEKVYYLPIHYHPNDFFRQDIETPVTVTGTVTVRNGKSYLFPYSAFGEE